MGEHAGTMTPSGSTRPRRCRCVGWLRGLHRIPREGQTRQRASRPSRAGTLLCAALALILGFAEARAQECSDENYTIHPDLLQKAFDKAVEDTLDASGKAAIRRLQEAMAANPQAFDGLIPGSPAFIKFPDNAPAVMKSIEAIEALAAADYKKLGGMAAEVGSQAVLAALGVPLAGEIVATVQIAKLSFDELKNQECLLDIDIAYYRFLQDPLLDSRSPGRVDRYLNSYIKGAGTDPYGGDIATNRRRLQCYIDKELPGSRVDISTVSDGPSVMNPFNAIVDAEAAVAFREKLKTPLAAMLSDFTARQKLEQTKQQAAAYLARADYQALKAVLPALGNYPLLADAICAAYKKLVADTSTGGGGTAGGTTGGSKPPVTTKGAGGSLNVAAVADSADPSVVSPGAQVVGFGDRKDTEVDAWIPFKFSFSPPAGGIDRAMFVLVVRPIGQLISTDTFHCAGTDRKGLALYNNFASLPTTKQSVVKVPISRATHPLIFAQLDTGELRCCVQDDTALFSAMLVINPPEVK
jgi:hypothetical protein